MAPVDDGGPKHPWGNNPWPGTENIKENLKNHPEAKDEMWFDADGFKNVMTRLKSRYQDFDPKGRSGTAVKKHLQDAQCEAKHFGAWKAGVSLHASCQTAQNLMLTAYDHFAKAFSDVMDRLEDTEKTNTGVEVDNVDVVTYNNIQTVDPVKPAQPGQPAQPGGHP
jgi:hypothetical protein